MPEKQKIEYSQLETGFEFPASSYKLDSTMIATYLKAVDETSGLYQDTGLVPPMAIAAHAMASLSEGICLPPGTIHVSQEFEFLDTASIDDTFTSYARVGKKQSRGKFHLLVVDLSVTNQDLKAVLAGKTSFILPEYSEAE
jgi:hypothetical protein